MSFEPNPRQLRYLEACLDPDVPATVTARCERVGIDRGTFYDWNKVVGFREWLSAETKELMKDGLREVWGAILKQATKGNVQAQRLYLERFDKEFVCRKGETNIEHLNILNLNQTISQGVDVKQLEQAKEALRALGGGETEHGEVVEV